MKHRLLSSILIVSIIISGFNIPTEVKAEENQQCNLIKDTDENIVSCYYDSNNDDLLEGYIYNQFFSNNCVSTGFPKEGIEQKAYSIVNLTGYNSIIYNILKDYIVEVADGKRESTIFDITLDDLDLKNKGWTAKELGVDSIVENGTITKEAQEAIMAKLDLDLNAIIRTLLLNFPYDLYWYDKTSSVMTSGPSITTMYIDGEIALGFTNKMTFSFPVADEYSAGNYIVDKNVGETVEKAVETAKGIVEKYKAKSDYEKLVAYKNEICDLVSYNYDAINNNTPYGNPWQLIYVFDEDEDTNVVCEGYSKAFQYLCELTDFDSCKIKCIGVSGIMTTTTGSGGHMWNIIAMDDGNNYLVDVTNCDSGSIGADSQLFLRGLKRNDSGTVETGYSFKCNGGTVKYTYYDDVTALFETEDLVIADGSYVYDPSNNSGLSAHDWNGYYTIDKEATCTEAGSKSIHCKNCEAIKDSKVIESLGHDWNTEYTIDKEPTYTENGSKSIHCNNCDAKKNSETIEKLESPKDEESENETSKEEDSEDETSKDEESEDEQSKDETSKEEDSEDETSKDEESEDEQSKDETSKEESPKDETSKDELPNVDTPNKETPKDDVQQNVQQPNNQQPSNQQQNIQQPDNTQQQNIEQQQEKQQKEEIKETNLRILKLSVNKIKRNAKKITGKVSASKVTVKIKIANKAWKKAVVKGKKFTLKSVKLKKNTKVQIKVSKKGYKTLKKSFIVK